MYTEDLIRQWSDYVTGVKDHHWASNRITLEFDWTVHKIVHNSEWWVGWKYVLVYIFFLKICVAFLENVIIEFTNVVKKVTITQRKC